MSRSPLVALFLVLASALPLSAACGGGSRGAPSGGASAPDAAPSPSGEDDAGPRPFGVDSAAPPAPSSDSGATPTPDSAPPSDADPEATIGEDSGAGDANGASDAGALDAAGSLALAIPMYIDPPSSAWTEETAAASQVPLVVANPNSGPGASADAAYTQAITTAHAAAQTIIGYVHTSYGARAIADVEADIDAWYSLYPAIDGIFSDETATDATLVSLYYAPLYAYVKAKAGKDVVVINPGIATDESYMSASDIVLSYEDTYANYGTAQTPAWVTSYPRTRFWHIVLSATQAEIAAAVALAWQRNVGLIYVTDQGPASAYQQIVTGAYWDAELAAASSP